MRQLAVLAVASFFFSCEDETSLGYQNPNKPFNVQYLEIPLGSSVVLIDSVITDNKFLNQRVSLVGQYQDNLLSTVKAESYLQLLPKATTRLSAAAIYDSATIHVKLNFYAYGLQGERIEKFTVHAITQDSIDRNPTHYYYNNSTLAYDPTSLGEVSVKVNSENLKGQAGLAANLQDTLVGTARLSDTYGQYLFDLSQASDFKTDDEIRKFIFDAKGLVLKPSSSEAVLGIDISSRFSGVTLHYHTATESLKSSFAFDGSSFNNISTDRTTSELAGAQPYQNIDPGSGMRYIQSGSAVVTKIDLTNFYAFADTIENILINSAELVINNVESPVGFEAHSSLKLRFMNETYFANAKILSDRESFVGYSPALDGFYFNAPSDDRNPLATISYQADKKQFSGYLTRFAQGLFRNSHTNESVNEKRLAFLALYPNAPFISHSVNRTAFNKDNIKLRISYTRPSKTSQ